MDDLQHQASNCIVNVNQFVNFYLCNTKLVVNNLLNSKIY